jgi:hypothetical protein
MDSSPPTLTAGTIVFTWSSGEGKAQTKSSLSSIELEHTPVTTILHRPGLLRERPAYKRRQLQLEVEATRTMKLSYFMNSVLNLHPQRANLYCLIPSLSRRTIVLRSTRKCLIIIYTSSTKPSRNPHPAKAHMLLFPLTGWPRLNSPSAGPKPRSISARLASRTLSALSPRNSVAS